ncbi:MAG TPA: hypothetical protein VFD46_06915 [Chryseolinea sp.]|nr:hypothetical protein [Chryseolinea sp.]
MKREIPLFVNMVQDTDEAIRAVMEYSPLGERIDFVKNVLTNLSNA